VVSKRESAGSKVVFLGFGIGFLYQATMFVLRGWREVPAKVFGPPLKSASVAAEVSPALLGVGYIIGPRIAAIMCAGGVMSYLVLIPLIGYFGEGATSQISPGHIPIRDMSPNDIRGSYILYIGAGAVTTAGIISLCRSFPIMWHGMRGAFSHLRRSGMRGAELARTERDLPMRFVVAGILVLMILTLFAPQLQMNLIGACTILACGFLFVTVSARLTGEVGSSANPVSGMALATLLLTCLIFQFIGLGKPNYYITALVVGAVVCIAISNAGTASQVLKTGFILGATPRRQQIAILIGTLSSAVILGPILLQLNNAGTVYVPRETYTPLNRNVGRLDPSLVSGLPSYTSNFPGGPSADHRELIYNPVEQKTIVAGLNVGVRYLVKQDGEIDYQVEQNFPKEFTSRVDTSGLQREEVQVPGRESGPSNYFVYRHKDPGAPFVDKYLVDEQGVPVYLVDPGINGKHLKNPDGVSVTKYDAPKATLYAYIIKGIFSQDLPWGLVLMGVMLALVLELVGIPSLVFAVGLYLPLSSSTPILIGGLVRWLVDHARRGKYGSENRVKDEIAAQEDGSPGVLMASGYIAGAAIAGIIIAFVAGFMSDLSDRLEVWAFTQNPFYSGPHADLLSLLPFILLSVLLYVVGRETWLVGRPMLAAKRKETWRP
jgi:uncharacterized oligopeptide transporter (OPT) family protein